MLGGNDRDIKDLLKQVIGDNKKLSKGVSQVMIENAWNDKMGPVICGYTERMYFNSGTLIVYLSSAPLRSELTMSKPRLMELLNEVCGEDCVKEIVLR